jgi:acetyl esterase/lipase
MGRSRCTAIVGAMLLSMPCWAQAPSIAMEAQAAAERYAPRLKIHDDVTIAHDLSYGDRPRNLLDIATPKRASKTPRPLLVFVSGGMGNRVEVQGYPFYENMLRWAVENGFIAINLQRDSGPGASWDTGARNIGSVIAWAKAHAQEYGVDPKHVIVWGHSTGATQLAIYISHSNDYGLKPGDLRGAILQSGAYNLAPLKATKPGRAMPQAEQDPAVLLAQSSLPGLKATRIPLLLAATDGDPADRPEYVQMLRDALCAEKNCPQTLLVNGYDHFSEIFSFGSDDTGISQPLLEWLSRIAEP